MLVCSISSAVLLLGTSYTSSYSGFAYRAENGHNIISRIDAPELRDRLRVGDEIIEFNGRPLTSSSQMREFFSLAEAGSSYDINLSRDGQRQQLSLQTFPTTAGMRLGVFASVILVPLFFQVTGLLIFFLKPNDKQALLIALTFGMMGVGPTAAVLPVTPQWLKIVIAFGSTVRVLMFATGFHFALIFPEPSRFIKRLPRLPLLTYLPAFLIMLPARAYSHYLFVTNPDRGATFGIFPDTAIDSLLLLYIVASLVVLVINYRDATQGARRKLRVLLAGWIVGVTPPSLITLSFILDVPLFDRHIVAFGLLAIFSLLLIPISFAYAVLRHQVIPVRVIVRRSVQYLLAKNALRALLILPIAGVALSIISNPNRSVAEIFLRNSLYFYLLLVAAVVLGLLFRRRLSDWIDRKFFREQYKQDQILRELIDDVKQSDSMPEMSQLISKKVDAALHPERMYLFYREEEKRDMSLGYSSGGSMQELRIPQEFELLRLMEYHQNAQDFPFPQKTKLPAAEKEWLAQLETKLIVPMAGTDQRLAGLMLLGQKKSEVPYTASDRQLLETLADQIAIVYENVRLKERVDRDRRVRHEVLARVEDRKINLLKECPVCGTCFDSSVQTCSNDQSELTLPVAVERTIDDRYRLDKLIGRGGMGAVYEANDLRLNRKVAVKILSGQLFGNSAALRRFEREAQTSARLSHPNIITIYDYGVLSTEGAYLVMELVSGETVGTLLKREKQIAPSTAANWLEQMLSAVGAAHAAGVIHRDLKPDNIFINGADNRIKILDFGLAKLSQGHEAGETANSAMTSPGAVMGTFGYMSPEQLSGSQIDHRADLFSIGVITVELITGRRPFGGKNYHEHLTAILQQTFHLEGESEDAKRLDATLQKCLAKDPNDRFRSAGEMLSELVPSVRAYKAPAIATDERLEADTMIIEG
jgi:eukaryotic-like serine/threonine-protein kinase